MLNSNEFAKENLEPNKVIETLFIGVGGMGSDIITKVASRCMPQEKENIRFVAMDTDANELNSVKDAKANITHVQTSSTQSVVDYLNSDKSAMNEWFPVNTTMYNKTVSEGAGQVRAISRLALNATIKSGSINKLYGAIDDLFLKDGGDLKQALRVVIVSSVAGGTGSGIAMVIGMLVRDYLHEHYREKAALIRGFLLLPGVCDTFNPGEAEKASLRRNGYATIKEINAFMIKASGFCGVRKDLERFESLHVDVPTPTGEVKSLDGLPFDFCFLLDRIDRSQASMSTIDQYKEFAAQSLYEQNIGPMRTRANSMEDNVIKEFANGDNLGRNRFGGIGASVLRYPYEQIADYIAFSQAIERIGCSNDEKQDFSEVSEGWLKYDKAFKRDLAEYKKNRAYSNDDMPKISFKYVEKVNNGEQRFDKDIKSFLSREISDIRLLETNVEKRLNLFLDAFKENIVSVFMNRPSVADEIDCYERLKAFNPENYQHNDKSVLSDKTALDSLKCEVDDYAQTVAKDRARAILFGAPSMRGDVKDYQLESLLKTTQGCGMHPNAMRYMLYALVNRLDSNAPDEDRDSICYFKEELDSIKKELVKYSSEYTPSGDDSIFEVEGKFAKGKESTLDDLCATVDKAINKHKESDENKTAYTDLIDKGASLLSTYYNTAMKYRNCVLFHSAYAVLSDYVNSLCTEYERFYNGFEEKAFSLKNKKREVIDSLKFNKGDSVINICGSEDSLKALYKICAKDSSQLLLPEELNAEIFDAIKKNAEVERTRGFDPRNAGEKDDIFDDVLLGHFRKTARDDYDEIININIIQAIQQQHRLENEDETGYAKKISDSDKQEYLFNLINRGKGLASPGIGYGSFDEDRTLRLCAYNKSLDNMLSMNVSDELQKCGLHPSSSYSISKYELHFFNALYNVTPDKLTRFKNPQDCKDSLSPDERGIYYNAYHEYSKRIGPDSTKSGTISSHIDKRWDAIVELPEISMNSQYAEMIRIHSCLIYGIVHEMIILYPSSQLYDGDKKIFAIEDEEGDVIPLIVSNGTECDEFYEVLDALYRDNASVEKIFKMSKDRRKYDEEANCRYSDSAFVKNAGDFRIGSWHDKKTSLFEIPLAYYNSLPRSKMDSNELSTMVDAVIDVLKREINRFEQDTDRKPLLALRLEEQFSLLVDNFSNKEIEKKCDLRKNTELADNSVIRVVLRKVCREIKELGVSDSSNRIDVLRNKVKPIRK